MVELLSHRWASQPARSSEQKKAVRKTAHEKASTTSESSKICQQLHNIMPKKVQVPNAIKTNERSKYAAPNILILQTRRKLTRNKSRIPDPNFSIPDPGPKRFKQLKHY